jgi:hypothetical protein
MQSIGLINRDLDETRINRAFANAVPKLTNWPAPAVVIELMPRRSETEAIVHNHSKEPMSDMMKKVMSLIGDGKTTRREWNQLMQAMYKEYGTKDTLGPTYYAMMCERHCLNMDAIAHTSGMDNNRTKVDINGIADKDLPF